MEKLDNIRFGAKPIKRIKIQKFNKNIKDYAPIQAAFVKLESRSDIETVHSVAELWSDNLYIKKIATAARWMDFLPIEIYALTTQTNNFNNLKPNKILGFAEMRNDNNFPKYKQLYHLQVKPDAINVNNNNNKNKNNKYKHVGGAMLESLKCIYNNISLFTINSPNIENFYRKHGFIEDLKNDKLYKWSSNIIERLKLQIQYYIDNFFKL